MAKKRLTPFNPCQQAPEGQKSPPSWIFTSQPNGADVLKAVAGVPAGHLNLSLGGVLILAEAMTAFLPICDQINEEVRSWREANPGATLDDAPPALVARATWASLVVRMALLVNDLAGGAMEQVMPEIAEGKPPVEDMPTHWPPKPEGGPQSHDLN